MTTEIRSQISRLSRDVIKSPISVIAAARAVNLKHEEHLRLIDAVRFDIGVMVWARVGKILKEFLEDPNVG